MQHIGAKKVIYQELDALIEACRQALPPDHISRDNQQFEVGVFNGKYVTPVPEGYFAHLEHIRGESKKMKVIENAREAVANGMADAEELQIATNGAEVTQDGKVVPSGPHHQDNMPIANGFHNSTEPNSKRKRTPEDDERAPRHCQDIAIHNQHDFEADD